MDEKISFGPYELIGRLSAGGMAEVHRARDTRPEARGRIVALKTLHAGPSDDDLSRMFEDEARIASTLEHPHIARVFEWGSHEGRMFIAYELVEGKDLRIVFENAALTGEAPPQSVVLHVIARISEALAYAHAREASIVHRDVSPQNVVLSFEGDVKLIDFGIAKAKGRLSSTAAGTIKGKFGYMSPEQVRGEEVDQRTDVFSLGICAWELLTLRRLFLPSTLSAAEAAVNEILVLDMVKHHFPDPPSSFSLSVPKELDRIVMKALAKNPDERYKSARELYRDLYGFIEKTGLSATRDEVASMMRRTFGEQPVGKTLSHKKTGRIMELQETRMSDDNKGGSDLDIFEGLGKSKDSQRNPAAAPPPPPGSGQHVAAKPIGGDMKKTLLGIPNPAPTTPTLQQVGSDPHMASAPKSAPPPPSGRPGAPPPPSGRPGAPPSGTMRAVSPAGSAPASKPPPPPGRGSLPNLAGPASQPPQSAATATQQSPSATMRTASQPPPIPPPASTRPGPAGVVGSASQPPQPAVAKSKGKGGKLDMDWDDDDEATHVFDKDKEPASVTSSPNSPEPERASMDQIMSQPPPVPPSRRSSQIPAAPPSNVTGPPPPAAPQSSLSGAFASLGQTNGSSPSGAQFMSGTPQSQSMRSAPPPPPNSGIPAPPPGAPQRSASNVTHPIPPPPPPGQVTTAPMHMPPSQQQQQRPVSQPPPGQSYGQIPSQPPQHHSGPPQAHSVPPQHLPPISRNMEATAVVPRAQQGSKAGLVVGLLLGIMMLAGAAVFFLMPRTATLVVNVTDTKGASVKGVDISVDDKSVCKESPCIVPNVNAGVHSVKVSAPGYEAVAPAAITIEARKDVTRDFTLTSSKAAAGTGFKVAGNQSGVKLVVDGKEIGALPQELKDLEPGEHKLKFVGSERYVPQEKTISVAKDEIVDVGTVSLKVLKGKATITLGTPGAKVYLVSGKDRKEVPSFPMGIEFNPSESWTLEATMPGHDDYKHAITWDDGQAEKSINVTLNLKGTTPPVAATPAAPKAPAQTTPVTPAQPVAAKPAAAPKEPAAAPAEKPEPAAKTEPAAKKEPTAPAAAGGEAFLNINSLPASTVVLDGKPLGPTPKIHVQVSPGPHTILFVNAEQSLKKSISVDVKAGETKAAFAKLRE